jgi:hypothetical protein
VAVADPIAIPSEENDSDTQVEEQILLEMSEYSELG